MFALAKLTCSFLVLIGAVFQNVASNPVNQNIPFSQRIQNEASCAAVKKAIPGTDSKVIQFVDQLCKQESFAPCDILLESARAVCSRQEGAIGNNAVATSQSSSIDCKNLEKKYNENVNLTRVTSQFFVNENGVNNNQSCYTLCLRDHHPICPLIQDFLNAIPARNFTAKPLLGINIGNIFRMGSGSGVPTASGAASKRGEEAKPNSDATPAPAAGASQDTPIKLVAGVGKLLGSASGIPKSDIVQTNAGTNPKMSINPKSETKTVETTQNQKPSEPEETKLAAPEQAKTVPSPVTSDPDVKPKPNAEAEPTGNGKAQKPKVDTTTKQLQRVDNAKEEAIDKPPSDPLDGDVNQDPPDSLEEGDGPAYGEKVDPVMSKPNVESKQPKTEDRYSKMPQLQYNDPLADPDTGYFGHFIMFLAVCAIIFLLLQNKKRIIAMVLEGRPKNNGTRRRTSSASGSYRKLENNFD